MKFLAGNPTMTRGTTLAFLPKSMIWRSLAWSRRACYNRPIWTRKKPQTCHQGVRVGRPGQMEQSRFGPLELRTSIGEICHAHGDSTSPSGPLVAMGVVASSSASAASTYTSCVVATTCDAMASSTSATMALDTPVDHRRR
jgi:hypothetical protein